MPTRPSPRSERLGTPNNPAIRFTRGPFFEASLVRVCYGLSGCSPPWTDLTEFPRPPGAFTSRLPTARSPFPSLDMTTTATGLLCWRGFHPQEWRRASLHQPRTRERRGRTRLPLGLERQADAAGVMPLQLPRLDHKARRRALGRRTRVALRPGREPAFSPRQLPKRRRQSGRTGNPRREHLVEALLVRQGIQDNPHGPLGVAEHDPRQPGHVIPPRLEARTPNHPIPCCVLEALLEVHQGREERFDCLGLLRNRFVRRSRDRPLRQPGLDRLLLRRKPPHARAKILQNLSRPPVSGSQELLERPVRAICERRRAEA